MYPECFDTKTAQFILFGILISHVSPASEFHGRAAMRAGAGKAEMHAVLASPSCFAVFRLSMSPPRSSTRYSTRTRKHRKPMGRERGCVRDGTGLVVLARHREINRGGAAT